MKCIVLQVPQHFSIPVLGGDEQDSASLTPTALPPTEPAEPEEAQIAEAPKPVLATSADPSSSVDEPFPNVVAALKEYKQKEEEATQAGSSASSAASVPSAVADPAANGPAPATAEVCSQPHAFLPLLLMQCSSIVCFEQPAQWPMSTASEEITYIAMSASGYLCWCRVAALALSWKKFPDIAADAGAGAGARERWILGGCLRRGEAGREGCSAPQGPPAPNRPCPGGDCRCAARGGKRQPLISFGPSEP